MNKNDHDIERETLEEMIQRYQRLLPVIEISSSRSSIVVRCHEYREAAQRHLEKLAETEKYVRQDPTLNNFGAAEAHCLQLQVNIIII